ncbi:Fur-regulated basic protein FbpA [Caldibacillus lycopersici]|uniref:Fur-regulated basic protein FbpA n=1 Tax=Perspicuibacillus lycopersici TaxID=1325689 RepID=A0AAE3IS09_9BACI|nr:Fur-regulated basic protein FbpA [Perspicuibacillus lycopersici]MCU9612351.1 Fur-regulated basic protein FbpA [Perspicuibacillus lycopersici]
MSNTNRKNSEDKRTKIIDKLIAFQVYKSEDKHLYELTLPELETEYSKYFSNCHPHGEYSSLQWNK